MTERTIGRAEAVGDEPPEPSPGQELESPLVARMRAAAEFLESVEADRGLLAQVPDEDRQRLLRALLTQEPLGQRQGRCRIPTRAPAAGW